MDNKIDVIILRILLVIFIIILILSVSQFINWLWQANSALI